MTRRVTDRGVFHLLSLVYPATIGIALQWGGLTVWMTPLLGGIVFPILDELLPRATYSRNRPGTMRWRLLAWSYVPLHFALLGIILLRANSSRLIGIEAIGLIISFGIMAGALAFPLAHEFVHSRTRRERGLGLALLCSCLYMHFRIEHVYGHHANVSTREDPATARLGEALGPFLLRSTTGQLRSAFRLERNRSQRRAETYLPAFNRVIAYCILQMAVLVIIWFALGNLATVIFVGQAGVAIVLLETVNYIEHYGLERRHRADGRRERVGSEHSWNSSRLITNAVLFNLGLHAHHHTNPADRYWMLTDSDAPRELPFGYFVMIALAFIPPIWRRVMDPLVHGESRHSGGSGTLLSPEDKTIQREGVI